MSHLLASLDDFREYFTKKGISLQDKTILDIGCRNHDAKSTFELCGLKWTGCDIRPDQPQGNIITCDMTDITFPSKFFDFLFVCHSLEHCENPLQALREFKRVLKEDGYVFISLPCHCSHHVNESDLDHIFVFTDLQIKRLLTYVGFSEIEVFNAEFEKGYGGKTGRYNLYAIAKK